jgi:hypothetical protein
VKLASGLDPNRGMLGALLDFGYGIVLWDRGDPGNHEAAVIHFKSMLQTVSSSGGVYPYPSHIAIVLNKLNNPNLTSKAAASATSYNTSSPRSIAGNYILNGAMVTLFALPDSASKQIGGASANGTVRIYLRANNWDLVQAGTQIGWAQRTGSAN